MLLSHALREITIIPFEFSMITGLPFIEREVSLDASLKWGSVKAWELLGPVVRYFPSNSSACAVDRIFPGVTMAGATTTQKVLLLLFVLIYQMIVPERSIRVHTRYLRALRDLRFISEYSWDNLA